MESSGLGVRGMFAAWVMLLCRALAALATVAIFAVAGSAQAVPFDPSYGGGTPAIPDPSSISYRLLPGGTIDAGTPILLEVTPSTNSTYTGFMDVQIAPEGEVATFHEVALVDSAPSNFAVGLLAAGTYTLTVLFMEDGSMPNSNTFTFAVEPSGSSSSSSTSSSSSYSSSGPSEATTITYELSPSGTLYEDTSVSLGVALLGELDYDGVAFVDVYDSSRQSVRALNGTPSHGALSFDLGTFTAGTYGAVVSYGGDRSHDRGQQTFQFTVEPGSNPGGSSSSSSSSEQTAPSIEPASGVSTWSVGAPVEYQFYVANGTGSYSFSATGLPAGVTMATNGVLSGIPEVNGAFPIEVTADAGDGSPLTMNFNWVIVPKKGPPPSSSSEESSSSSSEPPPSSSSEEPPTSSSESLSSSSEMSSESSSSSEESSSSSSSEELSTEPDGDDESSSMEEDDSSSSSSSSSSSEAPTTEPGDYTVSTRLTLSASPRTVKVGKSVKLTMKIEDRAGHPVRNGEVTLKVGTKSYRLDVRSGRATYTFKAKKAGKFKVVATYEGISGAYRRSSDVLTLTVKKKKGAAASAVSDAQLTGLDEAATTLLDMSGSGGFVDNVDNMLSFAPDQVQISASLSAIQEAAGAEKRGPFDIWMKGSYGLLTTTGARATSGLLAIGADYMFSPEFIGGVGLSLDRSVSAQSSGPGSATGFGWLVAPYLKGKIAETLGYGITIGGGGITNQLSPNGTYTDTVTGARWLASVKLDGTFELPDDWKLSPVLSASYVEQRMNAYASGGGGTVAASIDGLAKLALAPSLAKTFVLSDDGTSVTIGGSLQLALEAASEDGLFDAPYWRLGGGIDVTLDLAAGATLRGALDVSRTQTGATSLRGTVGLSATIN